MHRFPRSRIVRPRIISPGDILLRDRPWTYQWMWEKIVTYFGLQSESHKEKE